MTQSHVVGSILGTAIGDAIGLPYEGLPRYRASRLLGPPNHHKFFLNYGMVSDDTEHTCMVAQALIASGNNPEKFQKELARYLRLWLLGLPAGIGFSTLRAILRLWLGFGPEKSGIFSAGNGPAMRAAIIGAAIDDSKLLRQLVKASSSITHTDPKAEHGAFAIALAAQMARKHKIVSGSYFLNHLKSLLGMNGSELIALVSKVVKSVENRESTLEFAEGLGLSKGVSGYIYHSAPVAIHAWLKHQQDFASAIKAVIKCGGDTDSTAAMVGGIVGTSVGKEGIPASWLNNLREWPRSANWMESLAIQLDSYIKFSTPVKPIRLPAYGIALRNLFFMIVVLCHGFRRLLPPY